LLRPSSYGPVFKYQLPREKPRVTNWLGNRRGRLESTANGVASSRCDFITALGTLKFGSGETTKTITVLINQDSFVEGPETLTLTLSNQTSNSALGIPATATLRINDDATEPATNAIDDVTNVVRQQYHEFLNREPDQSGLDF
jgi:hypothetical protein